MPRDPAIRYFVLVSSVLSVVFACSDDLVDQNGDGVDDGVAVPNNVTVIVPSRPQGFLAGEVRDAVTALPIKGATVDLLVGGQSVEPQVTQESGTFSFGPLPAGAELSVRIRASNYADAYLPDLEIDDSSGNFPTANGASHVGTVALLPLYSAPVEVQVVSSIGQPVPGANLVAQMSVSFLRNGVGQGYATVGGTTDALGRARLEGLPNAIALPRRPGYSPELLVQVAPVDLDEDGTIDLSGKNVVFSATQLESGQGFIVSLPMGNASEFAVIASNVYGFVNEQGPSVLPVGDPVRVVFSEAFDRESLLVQLANEAGSTVIPTTIVDQGLDNLLTIEPQSNLVDPGQEYNLTIQARTLHSFPPEVISLSAPFFVKDGATTPVVVTGRFRDGDSNNEWGSPGDQLIIDLSAPLGTMGTAGPAGSAEAVPFVVELFVDLDLDGTSTVGDGAGELPPSGTRYPEPLRLQAAEPVGPGLVPSGFTRFVAPHPVSLAVRRTAAQGGVAFEARIKSASGGRLVTSPSGRTARENNTGSLVLVGP